MTLLENYKGRINLSESVYRKTHLNEAMSDTRKVAIATILNNENKFLTEAFANSVGTQRADLGTWKKFCLNLTTVALPTLIAPELVIVYPMTSMSGYITYVKYTTGSKKGATAQGTVLNDPFRLGAVDKDYTSNSVVEGFTGDGTTTVFTVAWTPVETIAKVIINGAVADANTYSFDKKTGAVTFTVAPAASAVIKIAYIYDNVVIPQNDLPIVNAEMASIPLIAKARRVAVYYSQIAAYQAKQDYGFNLGDQLAEKAVGELSYEIDTEITNLLVSNAVVDADLKFNKTLPTGVSVADHYVRFSEIVEIGRQKIYDKTKRFAPNYLLIASDVYPILTFIQGFKAAPAPKMNGPYFAGTLNSLRVFVTPSIAPGSFVLGVNGDDMMSSAAVYAPYMAIIPTQLLGYSDGGQSQGFSTLYALEMLNKDLLVAGTVVSEPQVVLIKEQA